MAYAIKEMHYTIQGEGYHAGVPIVLLRFSGCNLWSGREEDRHRAVCRFCDTDFWGTDGPGGGNYATAEQLAQAVDRLWPQAASAKVQKRVLCTGGEPLLQLDASLVQALHASGFLVHLETNGTLPVPVGVDWVCVSPKAEAPLVQRCGNELKLVFPQAGLDPEKLLQLDFEHFYLQPMDGPRYAENLQATARYCLEHPRWRISLQIHKLLGLP